ncbi:MAG: polymorphic membrane protein, partial [uncultured bacterium]
MAKYISTICVCFIVSMLAAGSARAATFTVTKSADTLDGSCSASDCSLREAIAAANTASGTDTVAIPAGTYTLTITGNGEDDNATGDLDVTTTMSITGAGSGTTTINANGATTSDRALHVTSTGTLTLSDVTLTGGGLITNGVGGGAFANESTATLDSVSVTSSTSGANGGGVGGGGIYNAGTLTVSNTTISSNSVTADDDNSYSNAGGGLYVENGTVTITDTTISGNTANNDGSTTAFGGGIYFLAGTLNLNRVTVSGNTSGANGGGIYAPSSVTTVNITNSTIANNTANSYGGGIITGGYTTSVTTIAHSTIVNNTADTNVDATGGGGGIYVENGNASQTATFNIQGTLVSGNSAGSGTGPDCDTHSAESIISLGYSWVRDTTDCDKLVTNGATDTTDENPLLSSAGLANNGGNTNTVALQSSSGAVDAVPTASCDDAAGDPLTQDQRGLTRPEDSSCDIGAYELDQTSPTITVTGNNSATAECRATYTDAGATAADNFDSSVTVSTGGT